MFPTYYLDEKKDQEGLSFKGFDFGACHESQFGRENGNAIDVVKLTEGYLFLCFHNIDITFTYVFRPLSHYSAL